MRHHYSDAMNVFNYIWPIALVVLSNTFYHISAKSTPDSIHPLAALTVTYFVGAIVSGILYFALTRGGNIIAEYKKLNWASFVLGIVIVGLEAGFLYAYKAGWPVSIAQIVSSAVLAVILVFIGVILYKESLTWNKISGLLVCLAGLVLINLK